MQDLELRTGEFTGSRVVCMPKLQSSRGQKALSPKRCIWSIDAGSRDSGGENCLLTLGRIKNHPEGPVQLRVHCTGPGEPELRRLAGIPQIRLWVADLTYVQVRRRAGFRYVSIVVTGTLGAALVCYQLQQL